MFTVAWNYNNLWNQLCIIIHPCLKCLLSTKLQRRIKLLLHDAVFCTQLILNYASLLHEINACAELQFCVKGLIQREKAVESTVLTTLWSLTLTRDDIWLSELCVSDWNIPFVNPVIFFSLSIMHWRLRIKRCVFDFHWFISVVHKWVINFWLIRLFPYSFQFFLTWWQKRWRKDEGRWRTERGEERGMRRGKQ